MAKMVGYACSIRLPWLNKAVQMLEENLPVADYTNGKDTSKLRIVIKRKDDSNGTD